jgi:aspartate 4-decarboxylase
MDEGDAYKKAVKRIIRRRFVALYRELGIEVPQDPNSADYYTLLDLETIASKLYGSEFAHWVVATKEPLEMLFRLAEEGGVVLLPGRGFGTVHSSARVSLANLNEHEYVAIGRVIRKLIEEYYLEFKQSSTPAAAAGRLPRILGIERP